MLVPDCAHLVSSRAVAEGKGAPCTVKLRYEDHIALYPGVNLQRNDKWDNRKGASSRRDTGSQERWQQGCLGEERSPTSAGRRFGAGDNPQT